MNSYLKFELKVMDILVNWYHQDYDYALKYVNSLTEGDLDFLGAQTANTLFDLFVVWLKVNK